MTIDGRKSFKELKSGGFNFPLMVSNAQEVFAEARRIGEAKSSKKRALSAIKETAERLGIEPVTDEEWRFKLSDDFRCEPLSTGNVDFSIDVAPEHLETILRAALQVTCNKEASPDA